MIFDSSLVLLSLIAYLMLFFGFALITEKGWISESLLQHPGTYILTLCIIVTTWSFSSVYISAASRGFGYFAYYLGFAAAFILAPLTLQPILRITRRYRLSSLADLFAFRFRSAWAGTLTTLILFLCAFPLLALQTYTLVISTQLLAPNLNAYWIALGYNGLLTVFSIRFGIVDVTGRDPNNSLAASLAFEGFFKILVLLTLTAFVVFGVFGGPNDLPSWLDGQPPAVTRMQMSFIENTTNLLVLLFFTSAIALPYVFHMTFPENRNPRNLRAASWGVPLVLLIASLPVMPTLWAAEHFGLQGNPQLLALMVTIVAKKPILTWLYFLGIVSAASGLTVVLTLSVTNMCMNHIVLRALKPPSGSGLYSWLVLQRRTLIVGIFIGGLLYYLPMAGGRLAMDTGTVSFIACLQFLPGILALLYWPEANSKGFICGLLGGLLVWFVMGLAPYIGLMFSNTPLSLSVNIAWNQVMGATLLANLTLLVLVSHFTRASAEEKQAAMLCMPETNTATRYLAKAKSVEDFIHNLAAKMGSDAAGREVAQALKDLHYQSNERHPYRLLQLRRQLEANLSSLLGPTLAHDIIEQCLPLSPSSANNSAGVLTLMEHAAESWQGNLSGIALDLDMLRRHHRQILQALPMGACELDERGRIALWNEAMQKITCLRADQIIGQNITALPEPWNSLLRDFTSDQSVEHSNRLAIQLEGKTRWFSLRKSVLASPAASSRNARQPQRTGQIILVEDQTETTLMEKELAHADRLSSIGRLAAGVAHEIGNPVTGIACLAQDIKVDTDDEALKTSAENILAQTRRISAITDALLRFSHQGPLKEKPPQLTPVELIKLADEAIRLFGLQEGLQVSLHNRCMPGVNIWADYQHMLQVLLNLLANATDASKPGGDIVIHTATANRSVSLIIEDHGAGIPKALLPRAFEPFFTTKDPGKGTGLGLALSYRLVTDLGGTIQLESRTVNECLPGERSGTRAIVTFPCYDPGKMVTLQAEDAG